VGGYGNCFLYFARLFVLYGCAVKVLSLAVKKQKLVFVFSLVYSYLYGYAKKVLALAEKNKKLFLYFARLFVPLWPKS